jgi:hypothetical protein
MAVGHTHLGEQDGHRPQQAFAAEDGLESGMVVKLDPAGTGAEYLACTAVNDPVHGIIGGMVGTDAKTYNTGSSIPLVRVGMVPAQVLDGQTLAPGDDWSPAVTKGKIRLLGATSTRGGAVYGAATGNNQIVTVSVGDTFKTA